MSTQSAQPVVLRPVRESQAADPRQALHRLHWYLQPLRRWAAVIALLTLAAGLGTYLYQARVVKPYYTSTAIDEVDVPPTSTVGAIGGDTVLNSEEYVPSAIAIIHSHAAAVLAGQMLATYLEHPNASSTQSLTQDMYPAKIPPPLVRILHRPAPAGATLPAAVGSRLQALSSVSAVPNSQDVAISSTSQNPIEAAFISNSMALAGSNYEAKVQSGLYNAALNGILATIEQDQKTLNLKVNCPWAKTKICSFHVAYPTQSRTYKNAIASQRNEYSTLQGSGPLGTNKFLPSIPAVVPASPVGPRPLRSALLAAFIAAVLMMGTLTLREYFTTTLRTPEEVTEASGGAPVLGAILQLASSGRGGLILSGEPRSATAEGLRVIRTNLLFSNVDQPPRIILLTSARQGEGKTTISSNLAASLAELGGRVLLIDADLRRPSLARIFGVESRNGLTNALVAAPNEPLDSFVRKVEAHNLYVMPSGPIPPNPAELLSSGRMRELLHRLGTLYDIIVVDSPPLLAVADPTILATMCESVILVADVNQATLQTATRTREALERVGSRITGVVLNKLTDDQRGSYYYNYYYRHEYGYGYGYTTRDGQSPTKPGGTNGSTPTAG